jgi:trk system potassium uptake protein TrkH
MRLGLIAIGPALLVAGLAVGGAGATLAAPLVLALALGEPSLPFLVPLAIALAVLTVALRARRTRTPPTRREALLAITMTWVGLTLFGSIPYLLGSAAGGAGAPLDALFESTSGFTATGATVITDLDAQSRSLLLWRAQTQWIGGIGLIILAVIFVPRLAAGGRQMIESETAGSRIEKLAPRLRGSALRIFGVYASLTAFLIVGLTALGGLGLAPGMGPYEAVTHAFTTVSAGGFSPDPRSIEPFGPWAQWLIALGIVIAGTNLALWFRVIVQGRAGGLRDEELRWYALILGGAAVIVIAELIASGTLRGHDAVREGFFQTATIMTGTGYATADFALWPELILATLFVLMFVGGCAGSPTGALKVFRVVLAVKTIAREALSITHPEQVRLIRLNRRTVATRMTRGALAFVLLYVIIVVLGGGLVLIDPSQTVALDFEDALSASAATFGNVGPGFGVLGPMGTYAPFSDPSKALLALLMIVGRLEIFPVLVLLTRAFWLR